MGVFRIVDVEEAQNYLVCCRTEREAERKYKVHKPQVRMMSVERIPLFQPVGSKKIDVVGAVWLE